MYPKAKIRGELIYKYVQYTGNNYEELRKFSEHICIEEVSSIVVIPIGNPLSKYTPFREVQIGQYITIDPISNMWIYCEEEFKLMFTVL